MPLAKDEQDLLMGSMYTQLQCPQTVKDRVDAFTAGVKAAIVAMSSVVSIDPGTVLKMNEAKGSLPDAPNRKQRRTAARKKRS